MSTSAITNTIKDPAGTGVAGVVVTAYLQPSAGFRISDNTEVAQAVSTTTNGSGLWTLNLEQTANINPANSWYLIVEAVPDSAGGSNTWAIQVTTAMTLPAALVAAIPPSDATQALTITSGDARYAQLAAANVFTRGQTVTPSVAEDAFTADGAHRAAFFATTSVTEHVATLYQKATSGTGSALNLVSDNPANSCLQVSGHETGRGSIKVSHVGYADASDANASALSIDLQTAGTAAQGIFITATGGATAGDLIKVRNNSREDFVVKNTGRVGIGIATAATPAGMVEVKPSDDSTAALVVRPFSATGTNVLEARNSAGTTVTRISRDGNIVSSAVLFNNSNGIQLGATSSDFGGGVGVIGLKNATTVPTTNPTLGVVLYSDAGVMKYRDPAGNVIPLTGGAYVAPTMARVAANVSTLSSGAGTTLAFSVDYDPAGMFSGGLFTYPTTGKWAVAAYMRLAAGGGSGSLEILQNGATIIAGDSKPLSATIPNEFVIYTEQSFTAGDTTSVVAFQNSGGNLSIARAHFATHFLGA